MNLRGFLLAATVFSAGLAPLPAIAQDANNPRIIIRRTLPGAGTINPPSTGNPVGSAAAVCGSADGSTLVSNPTTDQLCSSGTASSISVAATTYSWSCNLDGSTSSCSATRITPANGSCGAAQGGATVPPPATGLCSVGSSTAVSTNASTYNWSCAGAAGGVTASCSSVRLIPVNGVCGAADNAATASAPSSGLCSDGSPTVVSTSPTATTTGTGAFSWQCAGINTGTTASCASNAVIPAVCGSANSANIAVAPSGAAQCSVGAPSAVASTPSSFSWTCSGPYGGATASCNAGRIASGICGASNGSTTPSAPTTGICDLGTPSAISTNTSTYNWSCSGLNGGLATACGGFRNASVGPAHLTSSVTSPVSGLCSIGTASAVTSTATTYNWTCSNGSNVVNGLVNRLYIINASCGSSNGTDTPVLPTTGLCGDGNPSAVSSNPATFNWNCSGANGGANASCFSNRSIAGVCGTASGATSAAAPSSATCNVGAQSAIATNASTFNWTCAGISGGATVSCSGFRNAALGPAHLTSSVVAPVSGLCSIGAASAVTATATNYNWTCSNGSSVLPGTATRLYVVNGTCGATNGANTASVPVSGLCSSGNATSVSDGGSTYNWSCTGENGGTTSGCFSNKSISGVCGVSNGGNSYGVPSSLCNVGGASVVASNASSYDWTCSGSNGGATASCSTVRNIDGVCGISNGTSSVDAPSSSLCNVGAASAVAANASTYNWTCSATGSGATPSCASTRIYAVNGSCGAANGTNTSSAPASGLCGAGTASAVIDGGLSFDWNCSGANGGTNTSCFANKVHQVCFLGESNSVLTSPANQSVPIREEIRFVQNCTSGIYTAAVNVFENGISRPVSTSCNVILDGAGNASKTCTNTNQIINGVNHSIQLNVGGFYNVPQSICFMSVTRTPSVDQPCIAPFTAVNGSCSPSPSPTSLCSSGIPNSFIPSSASTILTETWTCSGSSGGSSTNCFGSGGFGGGFCFQGGSLGGGGSPIYGGASGYSLCSSLCGSTAGSCLAGSSSPTSPITTTPLQFLWNCYDGSGGVSNCSISR